MTESHKDPRRVRHALELTRRMHSAALSVPESDTEGGTKRQAILDHAEQLTVVTAKLIVAPIAGSSQQEARDRFATTIGELNSRYNGFPQYSHSEARARKSVNKLLADAQGLNRDWETFVTNHYANRNEIPIPLATLLSSGVGIIAPLTTDFVRSTLHRVFINEIARSSGCFDLKPAAVNARRGYVVLPKKPDGEPSFRDKGIIGIFVDDRNTGSTARVVFEAVKSEYHTKTVYGAGRRK